MTTDHVKEQFMSLRLERKLPLAQDVWLFELVQPDGDVLPHFEPGAHVTVVTPAGARRQYSMCGDAADPHRYQLGIKAERSGRGASVSMVDGTRVGDTLMVSPPENTFALVEADEYLFIAGGIGITPIMSMLRSLERGGAGGYRLVYCTRSPEATAFRDELTSAGWSGTIEIHHDGGDPDRSYDLWPLLENPRRCHVYCCGPRPLMDDVRDMTGHWPSSHIHFEDFASDVKPLREEDRPFRVRHADTGQVVEVPADATILEALREQGCSVPSSCESGTCGTCKTPLVAGVPDHRDMVLEDHQRGEWIMICVSRAQDEELVLRW